MVAAADSEQGIQVLWRLAPANSGCTCIKNWFAGVRRGDSVNCPAGVDAGYQAGFGSGWVHGAR
jgi:hypothetical protein